MPNQRTLRIHLVLEVTIPQHSSLFQALVLAFWRLQGLAATTLFSAVLQAIQDRARAELEAAFPGRFRYKGTRLRKWRLPFGEVAFPSASSGTGKGGGRCGPLPRLRRCPGASAGARRLSCPATAWR